MKARLVGVVVVIVVVLVTAGCTRSFILRANVATDGTEADHSTFAMAISADGRFVAFDSFSSLLVPDDTNGANDIFVHDNLTGETERITVTSDETEGGPPFGASRDLDISADGRYVAFTAGNLDPGVPDTGADVYVRDRVAGTTERVGVSSDEVIANRATFAGGVSADGRYVVFSSAANNLVPDDTNGDPPCATHTDPDCELAGMDVFVRDRVNGTTERVSVANDGSELSDNTGQLFFSQLNGAGRGSISDNGRHVVWVSRAPNVMPGVQGSGDEVYVRDIVADTTELVSVALDGTGSGVSFAPDMSPDGRFVTFMSSATDLVPVPPEQFLERHIYLRDRVLGVTERMSVTTGETLGSFQPHVESGVSADGRYVVFASEATDLVPGDTNGASDIFMRDRLLGTLERVSRTHDDKQTSAPPSGSASSISSDLSDDGRYVVFASGANNLVLGDTNGLVSDLFTRFALAPVVEGATPSTVQPGSTQVAVHGTRFLPGATVDILGAGVTVDDVTRVDEFTLLVDLTVAVDAAPGLRFLRATNSGTGPGASRGGNDLCACLTVG